MKINGVRSRIIMLLSLLAVLLQGACALETKDVFLGLNQAELQYYAAALRADPQWAARSGIIPDDLIQNLISNSTGVDRDLFETRLTMPEDYKLVLSDGTVLGDEVCAGEKFHLQTGVNKGEFWQDGGDIGSPPIYWVDDVRELAYNLVKTKVDRYNQGVDLYPRRPYKGIFSYDYPGVEWIHPDLGETIITSKQQQENFRAYLKELGYVKLSQDLSNAQYSYSSDKFSISVKKDGKEILSLKYKVSEYTLSADIVVEFEGSQIATFYGSGPNTIGYNIVAEDIIRRDGDKDSLTGIPIYRFYNWKGAEYVDVGVACSLRESDSNVQGMKDRTKQYSYSETGPVAFKAAYDVDCTYYFYGVGSPVFDFDNYVLIQMPSITERGLMSTVYADYSNYSADVLFRIGTIGVNKSLNVVSAARSKVDVSVPGGDVIKFGESNTLRVLVKNTGDVDVSLKSVNSRPVGKLVSCDVGVLKPGQVSECLLFVTPILGDGVSVQVSYDYKSCGRSQVGLVSKVLIASKVLEPVLSEQVYSLGVHGGCENSYYACNEAKTQPSLFAGYKCYKTSSGFYTPTTERFNLKFDLSSLPKGLDVSGARLNIYSNSVGKAQSVGVYSVDRDWKALQCVPGGDICARPYCSECAQLYDLGGVLQFAQPVNSADRYSFDVSALIRDKYSRGDSSVSLQVRGFEGLWEALGQSGCSVENNWEKQDVSFDSASGNAPYLEIVYKQ
jgi:hypothetical protein